MEEEVTFAFLPAFPGSGRTLPCSRWLAHLRGGCKVAPYTVWTSPRVWPQMPRHHWQWWTCPVNRKDVVSLVCPQCMFSKGYFSLLSLNTRIHTWENALHKDSRAGDLLWAMHKGTKARHCCFAGQEHHVSVDPRHLIRCSFHWGKPLETGGKSQRKLATYRPSWGSLHLPPAVAQCCRLWQQGGELLPTSTQSTAVQYRKTFEQGAKP